MKLGIIIITIAIIVVSESFRTTRRRPGPSLTHRLRPKTFQSKSFGTKTSRPSHHHVRGHASVLSRRPYFRRHLRKPPPSVKKSLIPKCRSLTSEENLAAILAPSQPCGPDSPDSCETTELCCELSVKDRVYTCADRCDEFGCAQNCSASTGSAVCSCRTNYQLNTDDSKLCDLAKVTANAMDRMTGLTATFHGDFGSTQSYTVCLAFSIFEVSSPTPVFNGIYTFPVTPPSPLSIQLSNETVASLVGDPLDMQFPSSVLFSHGKSCFISSAAGVTWFVDFGDGFLEVGNTTIPPSTISPGDEIQILSGVKDVSWAGVWSGALPVDQMNDINCLTEGDLLSWSDFTTDENITRSALTCEEFDTLGQS